MPDYADPLAALEWMPLIKAMPRQPANVIDAYLADQPDMNSVTIFIVTSLRAHLPMSFTIAKHMLDNRALHCRASATAQKMIGPSVDTNPQDTSSCLPSLRMHVE